MRAFVRINVDYDAIVRAHGTDTAVQARVLDLSGNGIRLWVPMALARAEALSIIMQGPASGDRIVLSAEVVRVNEEGDDRRPGCEVACIFE